ncbi:FKBP-type peptidyl-prolyl cis-trans isomerase [Varibaculum cambriense]|uniref:FKBP-type peptidyl-prolyl cis-trans isomerase n=1 Tax=Varibaculum cambriense TaxID=184870 RepID=UPI0029028A43|nr:FKBP-type peptidyl-prolyl cis-trans isomerase [Varibaculum cambriense]MDU1224404.1 FKBP-type peptidyl-prolyl cis-trans isomerase [Varibaculum cambriense]
MHTHSISSLPIRLRSARVIVLAVVAVLGLSLLSGCSSAASDASAPEVKGKFPAVTGELGETPQMQAGSGKTPTSLQVRVLHEGDGRPVTVKDQVLMDTLGNLWDGKTVMSTFRIGDSAQGYAMSEVIPGWKQALIGKKLRSRVQITVPPQLGFQGEAAKRIPANSTMVFVIDLISAMDLSDVSALKQAKKIDKSFDKLPKGLKISGAPGIQPQISIDPALPAPKTKQVIMLYQGKGPKLEPDDFPGVHLTAASYEDGTWSKVSSSWPSGKMVSTPSTVQTTPQFLGVPVGSRMVMIDPAEGERQGSKAHPARIAIYDIGGKQTSTRLG